MSATITINETEATITIAESVVSVGSGGAGSGDVVGPASATNGAVALFDGTTGKLLKNSAAADVLTALGITSSIAELNFTDGVTSAIQTQLDNKQPLDTDLTAIAALTSAADKVPYSTGAGTWALADFTALARAMAALAGPSAVRFYKVNADNTISLRTAAEMLSDIGAQASGSYLVTTNNLSDVSNAGTARTNLGATTVGAAVFTVTNPSAVTFLRVNADNTVTLLSAADMRTALSVPATSGVVTSLEATTGALNLGSLIAGMTGKSAIVNADSIPICDSENGNASKETTFTDLKAFLKTYNDTLYQPLDTDLTDLASKWAAASASAQASLQFHEDTDNGTHKIIVQAPAALAADWTLTLPDTNGDADQVLKTDGNGVTSWATPSGGALTNWTEARTASAPNATVPVVSFVPNTADTNNAVALGAKGTGAIMANVPDSAATGGDPRGSYAVDWQHTRNLSPEVASGYASTIGGGFRNKVDSSYGIIAGGYFNYVNGDYSVITGGEQCSTSGLYAVIAGGYDNDSGSSYSSIGGGRDCEIPSFTSSYACIPGGRNVTVTAAEYAMAHGYYANAYHRAARVFSNGAFGVAGAGQANELILSADITGTAAGELFLDGSTLRAILASGNTIWNFEVSVVATTKTTGNGSGTLGHSHGSNYRGTIKRIGSSTALVGSIEQIGTDSVDANMAGSDVTITADDTNEALKITFTPPSSAGSTTVTRAQAVVKISEIAY